MWQLIKSHPAILFYCGVLTYFSGLGQTFMISQYLPSLQQDFGVSRTTLGLLYTLATLLSAINLRPLGKKLDSSPLLPFTLAILVILTFGHLILAFSHHLAVAFVGLLLIRAFGQMPLGLIATTTVSRFFGRHRGKAMGIITLGKALGEGTLPGILVFILTSYGRKEALLSAAAPLVFIAVPLALYLIPYFPKSALYEEIRPVSHQHFSFKRDKKAFVLLLCLSFLPFCATGLFFQQQSVLQEKGWSQHVMAQAFSVYSLVNILGNFVLGDIVDRLSAMRLLPWMGPCLLALCSLLLFPLPSWGPFLYLGLMAFCVSFSTIVGNAFWAEAYGVENLGQIKGTTSTAVVLSTAIAPGLSSFLLDRGVPITHFYKMLFMTALAVCATLFILRKHYWQEQKLQHEGSGREVL